jgi:hypothetical protein
MVEQIPSLSSLKEASNLAIQETEIRLNMVATLQREREQADKANRYSKCDCRAD